MSETCLLCKQDDGSTDPLVTVGRKGLDTLIHFAQIRTNENLEKELKEREIVTVHVACRRDFTNPRRKLTESPVESPKKKRLRSSVSYFLSACFGFVKELDVVF